MNDNIKTQRLLESIKTLHDDVLNMPNVLRDAGQNEEGILNDTINRLFLNVSAPINNYNLLNQELISRLAKVTEDVNYATTNNLVENGVVSADEYDRLVREQHALENQTALYRDYVNTFNDMYNDWQTNHSLGNLLNYETTLNDLVARTQGLDLDNAVTNSPIEIAVTNNDDSVTVEMKNDKLTLNPPLNIPSSEFTDSTLTRAVDSFTNRVALRTPRTVSDIRSDDVSVKVNGTDLGNVKYGDTVSTIMNNYQNKNLETSESAPAVEPVAEITEPVVPTESVTPEVVATPETEVPVTPTPSEEIPVVATSIQENGYNDNRTPYQRYSESGYGQNAYGWYFNPSTDEYEEDYDPIYDPLFGGKSKEDYAEDALTRYHNDGYGQNAFGWYFNPWVDEYDADYDPRLDPNYNPALKQNNTNNVVNNTPTSEPVPGTPVDEPIAPGTPTDEPVAPGTPVDEPIASGTPTDEPVAPETPVDEPVAPGTPTDEPVAPETPVDEPVAPGTPEDVEFPPAVVEPTDSVPELYNPYTDNTLLDAIKIKRSRRNRLFASSGVLALSAGSLLLAKVLPLAGFAVGGPTVGALTVFGKLFAGVTGVYSAGLIAPMIRQAIIRASRTHKLKKIVKTVNSNPEYGTKIGLRFDKKNGTAYFYDTATNKDIYEDDYIQELLDEEFKYRGTDVRKFEEDESSMQAFINDRKWKHVHNLDRVTVNKLAVLYQDIGGVFDLKGENEFVHSLPTYAAEHPELFDHDSSSHEPVTESEVPLLEGPVAEPSLTEEPVVDVPPVEEPVEGKPEVTPVEESVSESSEEVAPATEEEIAVPETPIEEPIVPTPDVITIEENASEPSVNPATPKEEPVVPEIPIAEYGEEAQNAQPVKEKIDESDEKVEESTLTEKMNDNSLSSLPDLPNGTVYDLNKLLEFANMSKEQFIYAWKWDENYFTGFSSDDWTWLNKVNPTVFDDDLYNQTMGQQSLEDVGMRLGL